MDSETRCYGYKYIERPNIIIPHKCYSGDLPIEIIVSHIKYIKSLVNNKLFIKLYGKDAIGFINILEGILNKLEDDNFQFTLYYFNAFKLMQEEEIFFMLLPILDHIINKISSDQFFENLKYHIEEDLEVIVKYSSVEDPVDNSR